MKSLEAYTLPSADGFANDPLGYSALASQRWAVVQTLAGFAVDPSAPATTEELRSPILWLCHAQSLADAARVVLRGAPDLSNTRDSLHGIRDSQYRAIGLMLVGYSLEVCLKAMVIIREGVEVYVVAEKKRLHHDLVKLADFIPALTDKDKAMLQGTKHFVVWAGRFPAPRSGHENAVEEIFTLSEMHKVTAHDLFDLASRVMGHAKQVADAR